MKKSVLFIYTSMVIGGSTTALLSLLNNLDPDKYEIDLQLFHDDGPLMDAIPAHVNILPAAKLHRGPGARWMMMFKLATSSYGYRYLWKKCRGRHADAVRLEFLAKKMSRKNEKAYNYAVGFVEGWSDWYLVYGTKAKVKYGWLHNTYANITPEPESELPWMEQVEKIAHVTEPCRKDFDEALPQMAAKSVTIYNIMDSQIIRGRSTRIDETDEDYRRFAESEAFKIVTVCRLSMMHKGLDRIASAAAQLKAEGLDFLWYIIGDGEDREKLHDLIKKADVGDCVRPIGKRLNPYPYIAAADIMCMPSRYEGKPIAVTESMMLGTPPVVTEYLSAHEQIENGVEGIIAKNGDDTIAASVRECIRNRDLVNEMRAVLRSREYGNTAYISEIEKLLFS